MPHDCVLQAMNTFHRTLLAVSGGRLGWDLASMPVVELTTTGRKSGRRRSVMLTVPWQRGDTLALVASRGGDDHHPAWFLNLRDEPMVEITDRDGTRPMVARIADEDERAELWPEITAKARNYAGYQARTERAIPVVLLEPAS